MQITTFSLYVRSLKILIKRSLAILQKNALKRLRNDFDWSSATCHCHKPKSQRCSKPASTICHADPQPPKENTMANHSASHGTMTFKTKISLIFVFCSEVYPPSARSVADRPKKKPAVMIPTGFPKQTTLDMELEKHSFPRTTQSLTPS